MDNTAKMREFITLLESAQTQDLEELGKIGRAVGAAALAGMAALGGAKDASARVQNFPDHQQQQTANAQMDSVVSWLRNLSREDRNRVLDDHNLGHPANYLRTMRSTNAGTDSQILNNYVNGVQKLLGISTSP